MSSSCTCRDRDAEKHERKREKQERKREREQAQDARQAAASGAEAKRRRPDGGAERDAGLQVAVLHDLWRLSASPLSAQVPTHRVISHRICGIVAAMWLLIWCLCRSIALCAACPLIDISAGAGQTLTLNP